MSIGRFAVAAAVALSAAMASPAQAANCSILQGHYQQFLSDKDILLKELARVNAAHPNDGHFSHDHAYCMALRQAMDDTLLLLIVDGSCFPTEKDRADFEAGIKKFGGAAASETGFFCSKADLQAPLRPQR